MSNPTILYILECRHVMPGKVGTIAIDCLNCDRIMKVIDVHTFEWRMHCETCHYSKWCGLVRNVAELMANSHVRRLITHKVKVLYEENPDGLKVQERIRLGNGTITPSGNTK